MRFRWIAMFFLMGATALTAQHRRDPLTQTEIDQVRDTSWEPKLRLPLCRA